MDIFNIEALSRSAAPGDVTLGEMRGFIRNSELFAKLRSVSKFADRLQVRLLDDDGADLPDEMTLDEFRALVAVGRAHLVIDDMSGGVLAPA